MTDTTGLRKFTLEIDKFVDDVPKKLLTLKQKLALEALRRLVLRTPAATGHARANWQVTIGTPTAGVIAGGDPSGAATIADGSGKILAVVEPFGQIWISNNVPYIETLEKGSSSQAPNGMVAVTFADIQSILK